MGQDGGLVDSVQEIHVTADGSDIPADDRPPDLSSSEKSSDDGGRSDTNSNYHCCRIQHAEGLKC